MVDNINISFFKMAIPCFILGLILFCVFTPLKTKKVLSFIHKNRTAEIMICLLILLLSPLWCSKEINLIKENMLSSSDYAVTCILFMLFGSLIFYALLVLLTYVLDIIITFGNMFLYPVDDFHPIPNDRAKPVAPFNNDAEITRHLFKKSLVMGYIVAFFNRIVPLSLKQPPKPIATFMNSKGDFIRFYNREAEITHLISNFILLILFFVMCSLLLVLMLASTLSERHNVFDVACIKLVERLLSNDGRSQIFANKDVNLIFLMAGFVFIGLYYWLFSAIELFILKQDYQKISIAWRVSSVLFVVLPIVLCCFLSAGSLKFVALFVSLGGFLLSVYSANINKIKAQLKKEYNL